MDFVEQNETRQEIEKFLMKKFRDRQFHAIIAVEDYVPGEGVLLTMGTLTGRSPMQTWKTIVGSLTEHIETLTKEFELPDTKINKPVEPK